MWLFISSLFWNTVCMLFPSVYVNVSELLLPTLLNACLYGGCQMVSRSLRSWLSSAGTCRNYGPLSDVCAEFCHVSSPHRHWEAPSEAEKELSCTHPGLHPLFLQWLGRKGAVAGRDGKEKRENSLKHPYLLDGLLPFHASRGRAGTPVSKETGRFLNSPCVCE